MTASPGSAPARRGRIARRVVGALGGRYSTELGIDVDRGPDDIERWALAATLFGSRISAAIAVRTYEVFAAAGVRTLADAGRRSWEDLVELLDEGGYVRYDFRTAARLRQLALAARRLPGGSIASLVGTECPECELEAALRALPGWGPVTVRLFLRELRGIVPGPALDPRAVEAAEHLGMLPAGCSQSAALRRLRAAGEAGSVDLRDVESALVRACLAHRRLRAACPGGEACALLQGPPHSRRTVSAAPALRS